MKISTIAPAFAALALVYGAAAASAGPLPRVHAVSPAGMHRPSPQTACPAAPPPYNGVLTPDGDFNGTPNPPVIYTYTGGNSIPGTAWTVSGYSVDLVGTAFWPNPGACTVDLDGTPGAGAISETIPTNGWNGYEVRFLMSGGGLPVPAVNTLRVSASWPGYPTRSYIFTWNNAHNHNVWNGVYQQKLWKFVTPHGTTSTTIKFESLDTPASWVQSGPIVTEIAVKLHP